MDAFPRTNIDAAFAHDAFALIDVNELLRLDGLRQPGRVDFLELVIGPELGHRWIGVGLCHGN